MGEEVNAYKRWGLFEEEILVAFGKNSYCIVASEDEIMRLMDFLVNRLGFEVFAYCQTPFTY